MTTRKKTAELEVSVDEELGQLALPLATASVGEMVYYVMADGVTIRPAIVLVVGLLGKVNLTVFVDAADGNAVRGPHALGTYFDWRRDVEYAPAGPQGYTAGTWHPIAR